MFTKTEGAAERHTQTVGVVRRQKVSTPVWTKVQRFEKLSKDQEVGKSLRKVKKIRDKPGEGIQSSIKKFLQKVEEVEAHITKVTGGSDKFSPKGPLKPSSSGASTKPRLANIRSSPAIRTPPREGGKKGGGRTRKSIGSAGTLDK